MSRGRSSQTIDEAIASKILTVAGLTSCFGLYVTLGGKGWKNKYWNYTDEPLTTIDKNQIHMTSSRIWTAGKIPIELGAPGAGWGRFVADTTDRLTQPQATSPLWVWVLFYQQGSMMHLWATFAVFQKLNQNLFVFFFPVVTFLLREVIWCLNQSTKVHAHAHTQIVLRTCYNLPKTYRLIKRCSKIMNRYFTRDHLTVAQKKINIIYHQPVEMHK